VVEGREVVRNVLFIAVDGEASDWRGGRAFPDCSNVLGAAKEERFALARALKVTRVVCFSTFMKMAR
jgi:hypothetical protein